MGASHTVRVTQESLSAGKQRSRYTLFVRDTALLASSGEEASSEPAEASLDLILRTSSPPEIRTRSRPLNSVFAVKFPLHS